MGADHDSAVDGKGEINLVPSKCPDIGEALQLRRELCVLVKNKDVRY
jgi:hypothetical protein